MNDTSSPCLPSSSSSQLTSSFLRSVNPILETFIFSMAFKASALKPPTVVSIQIRCAKFFWPSLVTNGKLAVVRNVLTIGRSIFASAR